MGLMETLVLLAALSCPVPEKIIRDGAAPWDANDEKVLESAQKGCSRGYSKSPCVIKIYKFKSGHHHVTCGAKR